MKIEQNGDAPSFEKVSACVHCGLCLEACPTYRELRVEMDSPRGRIYLMKGILNERIEPTEDVLGHLDQCLDCRSRRTVIGSPKTTVTRPNGRSFRVPTIAAGTTGAPDAAPVARGQRRIAAASAHPG